MMLMSEEYKIRKKETKEIIIEIPSDIKFSLNKNTLTFEKSGIKNEVEFNPVYIIVKINEKNIILIPKASKKVIKAVLNTTDKLINNAITGLDQEFVYKLQIVYSHFPMTVKPEGDKVIITNFLGEKKPRVTKIVAGSKVEVKGKDITVKSHNKYAAGQTAGNIEKITRVTNKDFRVFDDGCYIIEKPHNKKE
jgi:large subunit ribosomal protein L6